MRAALAEPARTLGPLRGRGGHQSPGVRHDGAEIERNGRGGGGRSGTALRGLVHLLLDFAHGGNDLDVVGFVPEDGFVFDGRRGELPRLGEGLGKLARGGDHFLLLPEARVGVL